MKCPYRKIIKHAAMGISSTDTIDIEDFADCYRSECPFFFLQNGKDAFCRRAEADAKKEGKT